MSKKPRRTDPRQTGLFDLIECREAACEIRDPLEGDLNDDRAVRAILADDANGSRYTRWEIAGRLGRALGREVSKTTLDAWTATCESHEGHRFPLAYTRAWTWATGSDRLARYVLGEKMGLSVLQSDDAKRAQVQRGRETLRRLQRELRQLEAEIEHANGGRSA
jgi:hypothetical protein